MISKPNAIWLRQQLWTYRWHLTLSLVLTLASAAVFLLMPSWTSVLVRENIPRGQIEPILWHLLVGLSIFILGSALGLCRAYATSVFLHSLGAEARARIFNHILHVSPRQLNFARSGDVLSRVTNDVQMFQTSLSSIFAQLLPSSIIALCFCAAMAWFSPMLFIVVLLSLSPLAFVSSRFGRYLYRATHASQEALASLVNRFEEALGGAREIKSFGREPQLLEVFETLNRKSLRLHVRRDRLDALQPLVTSVIVALAVAVLLGVSVSMVHHGWITPEDLTRFLVCLVMAYSPLQDTALAGTRIQKFRAVMERLDHLLSIPREQDGVRDLPAAVQGAICFEGLHFSYPDQRFRVVDLNLEIPAGQMVALVGASGAGKSTLLDFILRFLVADSGKVLLDGIDIRDVKLKDLRRVIGIVPQEPILFEATLEENLKFGSEDATAAEVRQAAIAANVDEFAARMPKGYATKIEFRGANLSAGQRQRIALARALVKAPKILLFDEPTSALDAMSEDLVRTAIKRASVGRTTLIVAHRLSTVREADRVLVISEGKIVEDGTHEQLLDAGGIYCAMYNAQSAAPERNNVLSFRQPINPEARRAAEGSL